MIAHASWDDFVRRRRVHYDGVLCAAGAFRAHGEHEWKETEVADETGATLDLSVVIASFDSAPWLPTTIESLRSALERSSLRAEIVVVDDGSTDDTPAVLAALSRGSSVPIRIIRQENQGRFLARWAGTQAARADRLFLFDSRLLMDQDSFAHFERTDPGPGSGWTWNGHVPTDPGAPLVGRFWEVPTHLFWGGYLAHPAVTEITAENFDTLPKGTGCLVIDKALFEEACRAEWPEENQDLVSDDTRLLRYVIARRPIRLDPEFGALYRPRTTVRGFLRHAYDRGTLFVDSYAGTSGARNAVLVGLVVLPIVALLALVTAVLLGLWWLVALIVGLAVVGVLAVAAAASARRAPLRAVLSFLTYIVPFGFSFWRGLARGLRVHRAAFRRAR